MISSSTSPCRQSTIRVFDIDAIRVGIGVMLPLCVVRLVRVGPRIIAALVEFIDDVLVPHGTLRFLWHHPTSRGQPIRQVQRPYGSTVSGLTLLRHQHSVPAWPLICRGHLCVRVVAPLAPERTIVATNT
jgi:hypothetical protein